MIHAFIADRCSDLPVGQCCRVIKVSRSALFAWREQCVTPSARLLEDVDLGELIVKFHYQSFGTYGRLRVTAETRSVWVGV